MSELQSKKKKEKSDFKRMKSFQQAAHQVPDLLNRRSTLLAGTFFIFLKCSHSVLESVTFGLQRTWKPRCFFPVAYRGFVNLVDQGLSLPTAYLSPSTSTKHSIQLWSFFPGTSDKKPALYSHSSILTLFRGALQKPKGIDDQTCRL